ncbi:MAG: hypothetical protein ABSH38_19450 [Verrucomicrobiota bacterium]|jgi:hypothetical protein
MKTEKRPARKLRSLQSTLNCAIGKLDLRGADKQITKVMCIVDAVVDAAIIGEEISANQAFKRGLKLARCSR